MRGLQRVVEFDTCCIDVLIRSRPRPRRVQAVALGLLTDHLAHCVADATRESGEVADVKIAEASAAIARFVRS